MWPRWKACIARAQRDWGVTVYLEPGEACALNAGYFLTRVLDVVHNGDTTVAILDASAACHAPDVIEMPYRPPLLFAADPGEKPCTVRLAGPTCLAGDVFGDYSFDAVPQPGDLLVFGDMAIYTTCKNNTFNGMPLPAIWVRGADGRLPGAGAVRLPGLQRPPGPESLIQSKPPCLLARGLVLVMVSGKLWGCGHTTGGHNLPSDSPG